MKMQKKKLFVILAVVLALAVWFYPRPLTKQLGLNQFESKISGGIMRSNWVEQDDGSKIIEDVVVDFEAEPDSPAAQELYRVMSEIRAVRRWRLPFEKVMVFASGYDSFSMKFFVDDRLVYLNFLSDTHTIYDTGIGRRQFHVNPDSFEKLASVVEKYGVLLSE